MTQLHLSAPAAGAAPHADWFDVRDIGDGIRLISEPGHSNAFLVLGAERALLVDSGTGIAPVSPVVAGLTDLPVVAVSTHDHLDHRGGNADLVAPDAPARVDELLAHPEGRHGPVGRDVLDRYARAMAAVVARHATYRTLDDELFFAATDLPRMRDLPDLSTWDVPGAEPTRRVDDGEVVDLGGRRLRLLHTPGHAPDTLVAYEEASGTLLSGDTVLASAHWLHGDGADPRAFADSLERLARLDVRRVLPAHNLRGELDGEAVGRVARAARAVADGATEPVHGRDMLGGEALRHEVDGVVILTGSPS